MNEQQILDSELRRDARDPDDSTNLVQQLRERVDGRSHAAEQILAELPSSPSYLRRRIVRALRGMIPLEGQSLDDLLVSEDPTYLYYLFDSLKQPLGTDLFETLKDYVSRDPEWLAARAASVLTQSYRKDPEYIGSLLKTQHPRGVLVAVLKTLFDQGVGEFGKELLALLNEGPSPTVRFYAATLLKASNPDALEQVHTLDALRKHVSVDGYGAEAMSH